MEEVKVCQYCSSPIFSKANFCGAACRARFTKNINKANGPKKEFAYCQNCGKKLRRRDRKYCNTTCQQAFQWQTVKAQIEKNNGLYREGLKWPERTMKRYLVETCGQICQNCGLTEWLGKPINLIMDHIDGNASNWKLDNLRLVCPNCESYFPTSKGKNRGNGRKWRREARKAGRID